MVGTSAVACCAICATLASCSSSWTTDGRLAQDQGAAIGSRQGALLGAGIGVTVGSAYGKPPAGDPSTGGVFWSESKAQDRLSDRQRRLEMLDKERSKGKPANPGIVPDPKELNSKANAVPDPKELKSPAKDY